MQAMLRSRPLASSAPSALRVATLAAAPLVVLAGLALALCPRAAHADPAPASTAPPPVRPPAPPAAPKVIVSDIIIQGSRQVPVENIKNQLKTRVGREFVPDVLQEDVRTLFATRQFGNVWADKQDDGPRRVKVFIYIRDYPSMVQKITYKGNINLGDTDLEEITQVRKGMPLNPIANKVACRNIMKRYNEDGRPFASCDLLKGGEAGDTEIIFNIYEGPKVHVRDIFFTGNNFVSAGVLRNRINSTCMLLNLGLMATYNSNMVELDVNDLIKYYRSFGFHDVKVNRELVYTGDGREVTLIFHIQEGVRYRVADTPHVIGVKSVSPEALEALEKMKKGDFYDEAKIKKDTDLIKSYVGYLGHDAPTKAETIWPQDQAGIAQVNYEMNEKPVARVGQIYIVGNDRTRQNVILRQLPLYPGQILTYPDLKQAEKNLSRLGIFESNAESGLHPTVTVLDNPLNPDDPVKDILVNVQEANTGSLMFGVGVNSDSGLTGSIVLNERNFDLFHPPLSFDDLINGTGFRGAGQEFRLEAVPGTQLQRYTATFREPFLYDSPFSLTVSAYYYERQYNEYNEDRVGARVSLGRKITDHDMLGDAVWSVVGTVRMEEVNVNDVSYYAPIDYQSVVGGNFQTGFRIGTTRDARDSLMRPTEGSLFNVGFEEVGRRPRVLAGQHRHHEILDDLAAGRRQRPARPAVTQRSGLGERQHAGLRAVLCRRLPLDPRLRVPRRQPRHQRLPDRRRLHGAQQPGVSDPRPRQRSDLFRDLLRYGYGQRTGQSHRRLSRVGRVRRAVRDPDARPGADRAGLRLPDRQVPGRSAAGVQLLHGLLALSRRGGVSVSRDAERGARPPRSAPRRG